MVMVNGNLLGLFMFIVCGSIALVGGLFLRLPDPVIMISIGLALICMDLIIRLRNRLQDRWLFGKQTGGYLFFIPTWIMGIIVIIINIINIIQPMGISTLIP
ncbi:MAG: hypothetical protein JNJ78_24120 [Anaerolineae bacterium]|nr:hypothetical protein [Anaerolineae bacterium]